MPRDIDEILRQVKIRHPAVQIAQLQVKFPADDDGLWFFQVRGIEIQLESSSGWCPFVLESDAHARRRDIRSVEEAVRAVEEELGLT